jgi:hypothetical protein
MSAPLTLAQAADLIDLSIQKVFSKTSEPEAKYKQYFNYRTTTDYYEKDSSLSGLTEADFVDENGVVTVDVPVQGLTYQALVKSFLIDLEAQIMGNKAQASFGCAA